MAVLPVERSPMTSSRWPRPIGIIESIALMPVWSGSFTGWRLTTAGASNPGGGGLRGLALDDAGRLELERAVLGGLDGLAAVHRNPERVHDAPDEFLADRHADD